MSDYMRNKLINYHNNLSEEVMEYATTYGYYHFYNYTVFVDKNGDIEGVYCTDAIGI